MGQKCYAMLSLQRIVLLAFAALVLVVSSCLCALLVYLCVNESGAIGTYNTYRQLVFVVPLWLCVLLVHLCVKESGVTGTYTTLQNLSRVQINQLFTSLSSFAFLALLFLIFLLSILTSLKPSTQIAHFLAQTQSPQQRYRQQQSQSPNQHLF
jgi:energy-coupling factor transporter transmembrane protein EcfT